jgi:hypothetical protein
MTLIDSFHFLYFTLLCTAQLFYIRTGLNHEFLSRFDQVPPFDEPSFRLVHLPIAQFTLRRLKARTRPCGSRVSHVSSIIMMLCGWSQA